MLLLMRLQQEDIVSHLQQFQDGFLDQADALVPLLPDLKTNRSCSTSNQSSHQVERAEMTEAEDILVKLCPIPLVLLLLGNEVVAVIKQVAS